MNNGFSNGHSRKFYQQHGAVGGKASAALLTAEQRKAKASKAAKAKWRKWRQQRDAKVLNNLFDKARNGTGKLTPEMHGEAVKAISRHNRRG